MLIRVDTKSSTPVYQQIVEEVKAAIARGACRPGEMIPSVRQMATQAVVNPNTVARAYRELERDGVVYTRRGLGVFVSDGAPALCRSVRREEILSRLETLAQEAARAGMSPEAVRGALEKAMRRQVQNAERRMQNEE